MRKLKRLVPLLCLLGTALIVVGGAQATGSDDDQGCAKIHAAGIGQDLGGGNTTATISHGGRLNGTTVGHFDIGGTPPVFTISNPHLTPYVK